MALAASIDRTIRNRMNALGARLKQQLLAQVPVRTGALKDSINVRAQKRADSWTLNISYSEYGVYVNRGTRDLRFGTEINNPFEMPQFAGYVPNSYAISGKKGINPQWWVSLSNRDRDLEQFKQGIIDDYKKEVIAALKAKTK